MTQKIKSTAFTIPAVKTFALKHLVERFVPALSVYGADLYHAFLVKQETVITPPVNSCYGAQKACVSSSSLNDGPGYADIHASNQELAVKINQLIYKERGLSK